MTRPASAPGAIPATSGSARAPAAVTPDPEAPAETVIPPERGGPKGPEPTRYGDWEVGGICSDF